MAGKKKIIVYSTAEERINVFTHGSGVIFSIIACSLMLFRAIRSGDITQVAGAGVFGLSLILLYTASTVYHASTPGKRREYLQIFDHASIYFLIAGTYTPYTLITLQGRQGWILFAVIWGLALTGIIIKLFFTGRYEVLLTLMYVFMGWIIVLKLDMLTERLSVPGVLLLFGGGIAYTLGAVIYGIKKIKFNHAIFHLFVLAGSACHFISVYRYVLNGGQG